jgi:hypothetical protein
MSSGEGGLTVDLTLLLSLLMFAGTALRAIGDDAYQRGAAIGGAEAP